MNITDLTPTQEQQFLTLYDYCNQKTKKIVTDDLKIINKNGLISMTSFHWFQATVQYIMPTLFEGKYYWQDRFYTCCLQHQTQHPIDFLFEKYEAIMNNEPLMKETKHEYVAKAEEKESKKKNKK